MRFSWTLVVVGAFACGPKASGPGAKEPEVREEPRGEPVPVEPDDGAEPGSTKPTAIEVCYPPGERRYIEAMTCADGSRPRYHRVGSVGSRNEGEPIGDPMGQMDPCRPLVPGEIDQHVIDLYEITCPERTWQLYMDMYHCSEAECAGR